MFLPSECKMSWLAEFAGKAENFLNKVDQGAATALSKTQERTSSFSSLYVGDATVKPEDNSEEFKTNAAGTRQAFEPFHHAPKYISAAAGNIKKSNAALEACTAVSNSSPASAIGAHNPAKVSSGFVRPKRSDLDVDDDMLFDFLNSSEPPDSNRRDSRREMIKVAVSVTDAKNPTPPPSNNPSAPSTPPSTRGVSRASSLSSLSVHSTKTSEENSAKEHIQGMNPSDEFITWHQLAFAQNTEHFAYSSKPTVYHSLHQPILLKWWGKTWVEIECECGLSVISTIFVIWLSIPKCGSHSTLCDTVIFILNDALSMFYYTD